jgi:hypothetical protein
LFYVLELPVPDGLILGDFLEYGNAPLTGIGVRKSVQDRFGSWQ